MLEDNVLSFSVCQRPFYFAVGYIVGEDHVFCCEEESF